MTMRHFKHLEHNELANLLSLGGETTECNWK